MSSASTGSLHPAEALKHRIDLRDHGHEFCLLSVDSDLVYRSSLLATATCLADVLGPPAWSGAGRAV